MKKIFLTALGLAAFLTMSAQEYVCQRPAEKDRLFKSETIEKKIDEKKLDVIFECDEDRISVNADHDAIYQVFYNLCHNAVKFSSDGGTLRIRINEEKGKKIRT